MQDLDIHVRLQQKLQVYKPSAATVALVRQTPILVQVGISGAGKDTIKNELLKTGKYHHIVSHTTRPPRENHGVMERDGEDYHFIHFAEAETMLDTGAYVEVNMYGGNVYGASAAEVQQAHDTGKIATTDVDVQGVADYMAIDPNVIAVFILPPNYEVWQQRLSKRLGATVDKDDFEKRMATALQELEHALHAPYFTFVVNDSLEAATAEIDHVATGAAEHAEAESARQVARDICDQLKLVHAA